MVNEDDPQFTRFWDKYPRRVSKKDARRAWLQLNPSPELVDRMIAALEWQVRAYRWATDKIDFAPYPASWLNGERWTDEAPNLLKRQAGKGAMTVLDTLLGDDTDV